jgi:hypothetical protein
VNLINLVQNSADHIVDITNKLSETQAHFDRIVTNLLAIMGQLEALRRIHKPQVRDGVQYCSVCAVEWRPGIAYHTVEMERFPCSTLRAFGITTELAE